MSSEGTPLLATELVQNPNVIYDKFSPSRKRAIVAIISWAGLLPLFVSSSFTPTIPQVAKDLHSDGSTISWAISLSIFTTAFASMIWASYSSFYGRRPVYLISMPCLGIGAFGVAQATSVPELMIWRVFQTFGASGGMSEGPAVIGDIFKLEERGTAMGIFLAASLLGPSLAPVAGGIAARYASWRFLQYTLSFAGFASFFLMVSFFPETIHHKQACDPAYADRRWVFINPFRSLLLLRSPNLLAVTLTVTAALIGIFTLNLPLAYTIGVRYGITNEAVLSLFFSATGTGNILGAMVAGRISDNVIIEWRKRRNGQWVPEDRLRGAMFAAGILVPVPILLSGIVTHFVPGLVGIVINLMCLFINGIGVDMVLTPAASYNVDVMNKNSAEIMSAHTGVRSLILAVATVPTVPMINRIGVMPTDTIAAIICWVGFILLWLTIKYGEQMRAWIDVGYSTIKDV